MLATKTYMDVCSKIANAETNGIVLSREGGAFTEIFVAPELVSTKACTMKLDIDSVNNRMQLVPSDDITILTQTVGIKNAVRFDVTFISKEMALIKLTDGILYTENSNGFQFGFDVDGNVVKDVAKVGWISVKSLFDMVARCVESKYNVTDRERDKYTMNITASLRVSYKEHRPEKWKPGDSASETSYKLESMSDNTRGTFMFVTYEKKADRRHIPYWEQSGYLSSIQSEADDEPTAEQVIAQDMADEEAEYEARLRAELNNLDDYDEEIFDEDEYAEEAFWSDEED